MLDSLQEIGKERFFGQHQLFSQFETVFAVAEDNRGGSGASQEEYQDFVFGSRITEWEKISLMEVNCWKMWICSQ